jgi:hypothetical protein
MDVDRVQALDADVDQGGAVAGNAEGYLCKLLAIWIGKWIWIGN